VGLILFLFELLLSALSFAIFIRAISSWIFPDPYSKIMRTLIQITEPILSPTRQLLIRFGVSQKMPIDISPIVAIILLNMLSMFVKIISNIFHWGAIW
jgi:YggT family protein